MAERDTKGSSVILKFRMKPGRAELLASIADGETHGNVSELLRTLAERKIAERFPSHALSDAA